MGLTRRKNTTMSQNPAEQKGAKKSHPATNGDMLDTRHITICGGMACYFCTTEGNSSDGFPVVFPLSPVSLFSFILVEAGGIDCRVCFLFRPKRVRKTKTKPSRKILRDILDLPTRRSLKMIGVSTILNPYFLTR